MRGMSPEKARARDLIAYHHWGAYVGPYVGRSIRRTREMRKFFERAPLPGNPDPIFQKMVKDGRGMDGLNAAGVTFNHLVMMLRYHERKLRRERRRKRKSHRV